MDSSSREVKFSFFSNSDILFDKGQRLDAGVEADPLNVALCTIASTQNKSGLALNRFKWAKIELVPGSPIFINISSTAKALKVSKKTIIKNLFKKKGVQELISNQLEILLNDALNSGDDLRAAGSKISLAKFDLINLVGFAKCYERFALDVMKKTNKSYFRINSSTVFDFTGVKRTMTLYSNGMWLVQQVKGVLIGRGGYKNVKEALDIKTGKLFAIAGATSRGRKDGEIKLRSEEEALKKVRHLEKVVTLLNSSYYLSKGALKQQLVMPLYVKGSLRTCLAGKNLTAQEATAIMAELTEIVHQVHKVGIIHKDIKEDNFLVDAEGNLFLSDFGMASNQYYLNSGTGGYRAPETFVKREEASIEQDVFSLGVLFFGLWKRGHSPYNNLVHSEEGNYYVSPDETNESEILSCYRTSSHPIERMLYQMLTINPENRVGLEEVSHTISRFST